MALEKIQLKLQAFTKGFGKNLERAQTQLKRAGKNMQNFGQVMQMPMQNFQELNGKFKVMKTLGGKVARSFRMITHGMRGFRMEALGVMFFGMMMQKMFMGLLQPVMEAFGVFDIFRIMLLTLFLPVMEAIFPFLLKIMDWFMNLPESVKKAIGIFVVLGVIFGTMIMVLGQFALGIGSLIQFFPVFGAAIKVVGGFLIGLSATALAVIAAIVVVFVGMYFAWKENFMNMKLVVANLWEGIKKIFNGIYKFITGIVKLIVAIFKGDWNGAAEAVKQIFIALGEFIVGIMQTTINLIIAIFVGMVRVIKFLIDRVVGFFKWLYHKIVGGSIIPDMIREIIAWFWKMPEAVFKMFKSIVAGMFNIGKNLIQKMIDGIKSIGSKVIDAILGLFPKWMRSGIKAAGKITINIVKSIKEKFTGGGSSNTKHEDDFIWRPGQGAVSINPNDTLVGFKGAPPNLGGEGGGSITNNFYGFTAEELKVELDDRDRRLVDDLGRLVKQ